MIEKVETKNKVKGKKVYLYAGILYLLFISDFVARVGVNAIFPLIQADLGLSDSQVGILSSVVLIAMSAFVLPVSYLADRWSKKKTIALMAVVWSVATISTGVVRSFPAMVVSRFSIGLGNAAYAPASVSMLTTWFEQSKWGKVLGLYNTAMPFGAAIGSMLCTALAVRFGWQTGLMIIGGFSLFLAALSLILPDSEKKEATEGQKEKKKVNIKDAASIILKNRSLMLIAVGAGLFSLIGNVRNTWVTMFYVREMELSITFAAGLMGSVSVLSALAFPIGGALLDKFYKKDLRSRVWVPATVYIVTAIFSIIGFQFEVVACIIISSIIGSLAGSAAHTATQELVPAAYKSISYGSYVVVIQFLGAMGPMISGFVIENIGLQPALVGTQTLYLVSSAAFLLAGLFYLSDYNKARALEGK